MFKRLIISLLLLLAAAAYGVFLRLVGTVVTQPFHDAEQAVAQCRHYDEQLDIIVGNN